MSTITQLKIIWHSNITGSISLTIFQLWLIQSILFCCSLQSICSNHSMWPFEVFYVPDVHGDIPPSLMVLFFFTNFLFSLILPWRHRFCPSATNKYASKNLQAAEYLFIIVVWITCPVLLHFLGCWLAPIPVILSHCCQLFLIDIFQNLLSNIDIDFF